MNKTLGKKRGEATSARLPSSRDTAKPRPFPRLRIMVRPGLVLGPGKVDLLEAIERAGSISGAGRDLGMSYRRAWLLVSALNEMFGKTLVNTSPGGAGGGGAEVTDFGRAVVDAYRRADARSNQAIREEFARIGHDMMDD
ncbi:winged helix-turn-helix domain-containing protein [Methyloceanibacter caenitepidi]|nr:LysR family transcriptional regulator [Methyloceanibacter caenitepidi]